MTDALKRPLVFGDADQIAALKLLEVLAEFRELPVCVACQGSGRHECDCDYCDGDCGTCGGSGREVKAYDEFQSRHVLTGFMISELKRAV